MKLTDLRGILQYIPRFREKTFVIAVDGAVVTDENFANLLLDVAVLRSLNILLRWFLRSSPRDLQALKAEINMLRHKGGHIYTPVSRQ